MSDVNIADRIQQVRKEIETLKEQLKKKRADKNDIECKFLNKSGRVLKLPKATKY